MKWGWRWDREAQGWVRSYSEDDRCEAKPHGRRRCARRAQLSHLGRAVCWQHGGMKDIRFVDPAEVRP